MFIYSFITIIIAITCILSVFIERLHMARFQLGSFLIGLTSNWAQF